MSWIVTNGRNYLKANPGKTGVVANMNSATFFESENKAINLVMNLPRSMKNLGYHAIEIEHEENEKDIERHKKYYQNVEQEIRLYSEIGEFEDVIKLLTECEQFVNNIVSNKEYLNAKLTTIEKEQTDLEHAIEFYNLNACEGFKLYKKLKEVRLERRKIKDSLTVISILEDSFSSSFFEYPPSKRVEGIKNRKYKPRALKELFDCE